MARLGSYSRLLDRRSWYSRFARREGWFAEELILLTASGPTTYTITPSGTIVFSGTGNLTKTKQFNATGTITFSGSVSLKYTRSLLPNGAIVFQGTTPITFEPMGGGGTVTTWRTLTGMGQ